MREKHRETEQKRLKFNNRYDSDGIAVETFQFKA